MSLHKTIMTYPLSRTTLSILLLAGYLIPCVQAGNLDDPFDTAQLLAARQPCRASATMGALNLTGVVDLALCNNPQTREAWANTRTQAAQVGVARSAYLPGLSGRLASSRNWPENGGATRQNDAGLTLSWLLADFGARAATLESARELLAAASATQDATVQAVFLASVQAYYQVRSAQAALVAARESERASGESLKAAEVRQQVGSGTPADRLQAQTAWSQATLKRINAEGGLKIAQGTLANMVGRDAYQQVPLVAAAEATLDGGFERDVETLVAEARRRRPDLMAADAQARAAGANAEAARAAGRPTLTLGATAGLQSTDGGPFQNSSSLGVTLSIPLFSGFSTTYKIRAAQAQIDARKAQRDRLGLQVALDVWNSYQNLTTATQTLRSTADLLASAVQSERVALGRYKAGAGSMLDVLTAQSALADARQQRVQATFNWNTSRAALAYAMGSLDFGLLQGLPDSGPAPDSPPQTKTPERSGQ